MTRNQAIEIMHAVIGDAANLAARVAYPQKQASAFRSGADSAARAVVERLAAAGAFEDGRNVADRIVPPSALNTGKGSTVDT